MSIVSGVALLLLILPICQAYAPSTTVVTAFWKISSKHTLAEYQSWFSHTLRIQAPYVVRSKGLLVLSQPHSSCT